MSASLCVEPGNTRLSLVNNLNTCFLLVSEDEGVEAVHVEDGAVYTGSLGGLVQVTLNSIYTVFSLVNNTHNTCF